MVLASGPQKASGVESEIAGFEFMVTLSDPAAAPRQFVDVFTP
jgi:hypothetical protein